MSVVDHFGAVGFRPGIRRPRAAPADPVGAGDRVGPRTALGADLEDGDKVRVAWSADEQRVRFEKIVKDTSDDSPDDQAKAGIEEPSEVAEDKTDVPTPSVGDEVQSKDDKSAE